MKKIIKAILKWIKETFQFVIFLVYLLMKGTLKNQLRRDCKGTMCVLANGPSLKQSVQEILEKDGWEKNEYVVLNYFAFDDVFQKIKPAHYCLADPMFFSEGHRIQEVRKLFSILENVDWEISLYVPSWSRQKFLKFSNLKNKNIKVIGVNTIAYNGYKGLANTFYSKGLATPRVQTVAHLAIYISIMRGYKTINLYGVDHNFTASLVVDDNNRLCSKDEHFYDKGAAKLKPLLRTENGEVYKISDYLSDISYMFKGHEQLQDFAEYMGARIINNTKGSMIDCYERA